MKIDKEIVSKISREYIFLSGIFDIDAKYFKKRIDEGVQNSGLSYPTNVHGKQTGWQFFQKDEKFLALLLPLIDYLEGLDLKLAQFYLKSAWGLIETFGDYTNRHMHSPASLSGVLYLNDHHQKLYFPEINRDISPEEGRFVLFSSFLTHYTKRNSRPIKKYAISFNFFPETYEQR